MDNISDGKYVRLLDINLKKTTTTSHQNNPKSIGELRFGMRLSGTVRRVTAFTALIEIGVGQEAFLSISDIQQSGKRTVRDLLKVGDKISVAINGINENSVTVSWRAPSSSRRKTSQKSRKSRQSRKQKVRSLRKRSKRAKTPRSRSSQAPAAPVRRRPKDKPASRAKEQHHRSSRTPGHSTKVRAESQRSRRKYEKYDYLIKRSRPQATFLKRFNRDGFARTSLEYDRLPD